jgi:hypothetical protein
MPIETIVEIASGIVEIGAEASSEEGKKGAGCFIISLVIAVLLVVGYIYFSD